MLRKEKKLLIQHIPNERFRALRSPELFITVKAFNPRESFSRFAVLISKKTAKKATERNKIRRIIYSWLNKNNDQIKIGDYLLIINKIAPKDILEVELKSVF